MAGVISTTLPDDSALFSYMRPGDFLDCYAKPSSRPLNEVAERVFAFPRWVGWLMKLRHALVAPFGVSTTPPDTKDRIGFFPVISRAEDEIILGMDDSHLDFRIALMVRNGVAYSATWVRTNNRFGRFYLSLIMPFHILIVRNAIGRA